MTLAGGRRRGEALPLRVALAFTLLSAAALKLHALSEGDAPHASLLSQPWLTVTISTCESVVGAALMLPAWRRAASPALVLTLAFGIGFAWSSFVPDTPAPCGCFGTIRLSDSTLWVIISSAIVCALALVSRAEQSAAVEEPAA